MSPARIVERPFDETDFRRTLAQYPTGVTVITATAGSRPIGMTANSFVSVSLEPPLVAWCVARSSSSHDAFVAAPSFAVHVLGADHEDLARSFAARGTDKFGALPHRTGDVGAPVIDGVAPVFECRTWACYPGGDHTIMVGEVTGLVMQEAEPLLFHSGVLRGI